MPSGRKGYYSITIEDPNQYKSTVSAFTVEFQHTPKPEQLSRVPLWQAIGGKTSTLSINTKLYSQTPLRVTSNTKTLISFSPKVYILSHLMFGHMHEVLNID
jgi:hypothetical protein